MKYYPTKSITPKIVAKDVWLLCKVGLYADAIKWLVICVAFWIICVPWLLIAVPIACVIVLGDWLDDCFRQVGFIGRVLNWKDKVGDELSNKYKTAKKEQS